MGLNNLIAGIIVLCSVLTCGYSNKLPDVNGIELAIRFDAVDAYDGSMKSPISKSYIFEKGGQYVLFEPYDQSWTKNGTKIDSIEHSFKYLVFKRNETNGLKYLSIDDRNPIKFNVDSILFKNNLKVDFYKTKYYQLDAEKKVGDTLITQNWLLKNKVDDTYCDSIYYRFSNKFSSVNFFLSDTVIHRSYHLAGTRMVYKKVKDGIKKGIDIPQREISIQINEVSDNKLFEKAIQILEYYNKNINK